MTPTEIQSIINFLTKTKRETEVTLINLKTGNSSAVEVKPKPKWRPRTPPEKQSSKRDAAIEKWKKIKAGELPAPNLAYTPERRAKISAIHKGKVTSEETKAKMSATKKARRAAKELLVTCPHCGFMGWNSPNTTFNRAHAYMTEHHFSNCMDSVNNTHKEQS